MRALYYILSIVTVCRKMSQKTQIQQFFDGKSIFLTGGTGFLGGLLIEKLLRCCPDVAKIYVMVREKRGVGSEERLREFFRYPIFDELKANNRECLKKVICVGGNLEIENLGLSVEDWNAIVENVECIFHVGASLSFISRLSSALMSNVFGTREVVRLAKEAKELKCLIYVSSVYSQCDKRLIEEKIYCSDISGDDMLYLQQRLGAKLNEVESVFVGKFPNTYTYSKFLAEDFLSRNALDIPFGIVRPSIVLQTWKEPIRGWTTPTNNIAEYLQLYALGACHIFHSNPHLIIDVIPADYVVSNIIAVAWEIGTSWNSKNEDVAVFNCGSSQRNPITSKQIVEFLVKYSKELPSNREIWSPFIVLHPSAFYFHLFYYLQLPQILLLDLVNYVLRKPSAFLKMYNKAYRLVSVFSYFTSKTWFIKTDNTERLWNKMEERDRKLFNFDTDTIQWSSVFYSIMYGGQKHIFVQQARRKQLALHKSTLCIAFMLICLIFYVFLVFGL